MLIFSFIFAQWSSLAHPSFAFYSLLSRIFEILAGVLLFYSFYYGFTKKVNFFFSQFLSIIGLLLVFSSFLILNKQTPWPSIFSLIPIIGTCLILQYADCRTYVGKFLANKIFVGIGLISYSTYLWHQPLLAFAKIRFITNPSYINANLICLISLFIGYLSWTFIEKPFRKLQCAKERNGFFS